MADFVNDPPPRMVTVDFSELAAMANEKLPDPPVYEFSNGRKFYEPLQYPFEDLA